MNPNVSPCKPVLSTVTQGPPWADPHGVVQQGRGSTYFSVKGVESTAKEIYNIFSLTKLDRFDIWMDFLLQRLTHTVNFPKSREPRCSSKLPEGMSSEPRFDPQHPAVWGAKQENAIFTESMSE